MSDPVTKAPAIYAYLIDAAEGERQVLSLLSPADAASGLPSEAIVGSLRDAKGAIEPENFAANPLFGEFLHHVIERHATRSQAFRDEARRLRAGWLFVTDLRTAHPEGPVPPEDILGAFRIENGEVLPHSYQRSDRHRLLTERGFFRLDPAVERALIDALRGLERDPTGRDVP
jgi:hypothetical protein